MDKIKEPHIVKRALCAIVDFAFAFLFGLGIFTAVSATLTNIPNGVAIKNEITSYYLDSGLFILDDTGNPTGNTLSNRYEDHYKMLHRYYTVYLTSECPEIDRSSYDDYWFNVFILGLEDKKGLFSYEQIKNYPEPRAKGASLFSYPRDLGGEFDLDKPGIPRDELHENGDPTMPLTAEGRTELARYFYNDSTRNCDFNAGYDLTHRKFFLEAQFQYELRSTVIPLVSAVVVSSLLFFFVFPMVFKDGQTLGKKIFGFGVLSYSGYASTRGQILLRQLPPILLGVIAFAFASGLVAAILMGTLLFISYILSIFSRDHRAIHDFTAYTFVADIRESVYFKNPEEEEFFEKARGREAKKEK